MKRNMLKWPMLLVSVAILFVACKKDNEGEGNEEELITTVILKATPQGGGNTLQFSYDDLDGPGGNQPARQEVVLAQNTQYNFSLELLDKTKTPAAGISEEVEAEGEEHRLYYLPSGGSNLTFSGLNNDADGIALGTTGILTTGASATGTLRVVLRHYGGNPPNKAANDPVDSPKSSTDVDVTFNVRLQ